MTVDNTVETVDVEKLVSDKKTVEVEETKKQDRVWYDIKFDFYKYINLHKFINC